MDTKLQGLIGAGLIGSEDDVRGCIIHVELDAPVRSQALGWHRARLCSSKCSAHDLSSSAHPSVIAAAGAAVQVRYSGRVFSEGAVVFVSHVVTP